MNLLKKYAISIGILFTCLLFSITALAQPSTRPAFAPPPKQTDIWLLSTEVDLTNRLNNLKSNTHLHLGNAVHRKVTGTVVLPKVDNVTIEGVNTVLECTLKPGNGTVIDASNTSRFSMKGFYFTTPVNASVFSAGEYGVFGPNVVTTVCQHWVTMTYPFANGSVITGLSGQKTMGQTIFNIGCDDVWLMNSQFVGTVGEDMIRWVRGNEVHKSMDDGHKGNRFHIWYCTFTGPNVLGKSACSARVGVDFDFYHNFLKKTYLRIGEDAPGSVTLSKACIRENIFDPDETFPPGQSGFPISQINYMCKNDGAVVDHNIFNTTQLQCPMACTGQDATVFKSLNGNTLHSTDGYKSKPLVSFWQSSKNSNGTNITIN